MDIATLTNAPREATFLGTTYRVSALTIRRWGAFQSWLKDHSPSPLARVRDADLAGLVESDRQFVLRLAFLEMTRWPPRLRSREWMDAIDAAPDGYDKLIMTVLGQHQEVTPEAAADLADRFDSNDFGRLILLAFGDEIPDPKSAAPAGPTTPTTGASETTGANSSTPSAGPEKG